MNPFINEFHYDNNGADANEFIELAGLAGLDFAGWILELYNGNNGALYDSIVLSGQLGDDSGTGFGFLTVNPSDSLQNGPPDGLALVNPSGVVMEFLSYEGSFMATGGAAAGLTSTDIGVAESGSTPEGYSLQREGTGSKAADFSFTPPQSHTPGAVNNGQILKQLPASAKGFSLEILHFADQEASSSAIVNAPNLSGVLNALRAQDLGNDGLADHTLTLSSGDAFIPGVFFSASEAVFGTPGIADFQIQNELGVQAIAFGNHEFDNGTELLASLIDGSADGDFSALVGSNLEGLDFQGSLFPYLSTNLDTSTDVNLAPLEVSGGQAPQRNVVTSSTVITQAANGPSMLTGENGFTAVPIFSVGETFNGTSGTLNASTAGDYSPPGILDGIGAYATNEDTVRVLVNHELTSADGYAYSLENGTTLTGARVSYFDIDKTSRQIVDAGLAYNTIYNPDGSVLDDASDFAFSSLGIEGLNRLCSSILIEAEQFGTGMGLVDRVYFTGEEFGGGGGGNEWALDVATGELWAVPAMGRGAWENVTEIDTGTTTHVAFILADDSAPQDIDGDGTNEAAPLFLYVGEKNGIGDNSFLDRNGLAQGRLFVWVSDSGETLPSEFNGTTASLAGSWVEVDNNQNPAEASVDGSSGYDKYGYPTQANLWIQAESEGAFGFSRPEDVATNPFDGSQVVLASTGRSSYDGGADTVGTLYTVSTDFSDINAPTGQRHHPVRRKRGSQPGPALSRQPRLGRRRPDLRAGGPGGKRPVRPQCRQPERRLDCGDQPDHRGGEPRRRDPPGRHPRRGGRERRRHRPSRTSAPGRARASSMSPDPVR
jgi:hypothetical protein